MALRDYLPGRELVRLNLETPIATKESRTTQPIIVNLGVGNGQTVSQKRSPAQLTDAGYQQNITVFDCVNLRSQAVAGLPFCLMERAMAPVTAEDGKTRYRPVARKIMSARVAWNGYKLAQRGNFVAKRALASAYVMEVGRKANAPTEPKNIDQHQLLTLVEHPNPYMSATDWLEAFQAFLLLNGNTYLEYIWPDTGPNRLRPMEIYPMRPDRTKVVPGARGSGRRVAGYVYTVGTEKETYEVDQVLHRKFFAPLDDFYGLSPLAVAARTILTDNEARRWNHNLLANDARPSGAFTAAEELAQDSFDRLKAEVKANIAGASNAGVPLVLDGGLDWKTLTLSPLELDFLESLDANAIQICAALKTPPELVGSSEHKTYNSYPEARTSFYQETVIPDGERLCDDLNRDLVPRFGNDRLYFDIDRDLVEAIQEDREKAWSRVSKADWLSVNEQRAATGFDEYTENAESANEADVPRALRKVADPMGDEPNPNNGPIIDVQPEPKRLAAARIEQKQNLTPKQRRLQKRMRAVMAKHFRDLGPALAEHVKKAVGDL